VHFDINDGFELLGDHVFQMRGDDFCFFSGNRILFDHDLIVLIDEDGQHPFFRYSLSGASQERW